MRALLAAALASLLLAAPVPATAADYPSPRALATGPSDPSVDWDRRAVARLRHPPLGLPTVPVPTDNPPTEAKVSLGRKLFFDRRLSANGTISCGICHVPEQGFTNNELATPVGVEGRSVRRNAPTIFHVAYEPAMFHDARDPSLETQIFGPLLARNEMAAPAIGWVLERIEDLPDYAGRFEAAFGAPVNVLNLGRALATYQRTVLSANSPFDRERFGGETGAMTAAARRGLALFEGRAGCVQCHPIGDKTALFTDHDLHNTGIGYRSDVETPSDSGPVMVEITPGVTVPLDRAAVDAVGGAHLKDLGRMEVTNDPDDLYRFKTPSLRNVALTAPYMHDGSLQTLGDVVRFYDRGGHANPGLDPAIRPLGLSDGEVADLVAFLKGLTGDNLDALIGDARSVGVGN